MEPVQLKDKQAIDFYNDSNVTFWTRKLNITPQQLTDAVINTGSLYIVDIKKYIGIKDSFLSLLDFVRWKRSSN
jgi:hypothetical protein